MPSTLGERQSEHVGASFIVWNKDRVDEPESSAFTRRLDPNFLCRSQFPFSTFHQCLHKFAQTNRGKPLLHIDIHGKKDRKINSEIDLGVKAVVEGFSLQD